MSAAGDAETATIQGPVDALRLVCGPSNRHLKFLERRIGVQVAMRDDTLVLRGASPSVIAMTKDLLGVLLARAERGTSISLEDIRSLFASSYGGRMTDGAREHLNIDILRTHAGGTVTPRSVTQGKYVNAISENAVTFGVGPAGTGKTYLAVAVAVAAYRQRKCSRIILTRPAVEAGERLGFLPGDLAAKLNPYLRPLHDALFEFLGPDEVERLTEERVIEVAPLAFMRGRTLNHAVVILDEAQNATRSQMKMFLTRLGQTSTMVINGDLSQVDLIDDRGSGLLEAVQLLEGTEDVATVRFAQSDVVRHGLVKKIIAAYEGKAPIGDS